MAHIWNFIIILAQQVQIEDGGGDNFVSQIAGLLIVTVLAGVIWLGLMIMIFRRTVERRRRKKEGLEPLPSIPTQILQWWEQRNQPGTAPRSMAASRRSPSLSVSPGDIPMPDLDELDFNIDDVLGAPPVVGVTETRGEIMNAPPPPPIPEPVVEDVPLQEPEVSTAMNYVPGSNQLPEDAVEIMRVWRDVTDGTLIIGMRDRLFATQAELDDDLGRRYRKLVQDLSGLASTAPAASPPPVRRPAPPPSISTASPSQKPPANEPVPAVSIGEQIENLLQQRLLQYPQFQGRRIHVRSGGSGGVVIEVDGQFYEAVSDIGDAQVRSFIQETIQEWETHQ